MVVMVLNGVIREFKEYLLSGRWPWVSKKKVKRALDFYISEGPIMEKCRTCPMEVPYSRWYCKKCHGGSYIPIKENIILCTDCYNIDEGDL